MSDGLTRREMTKACVLGVASLALAETTTLAKMTDVAAAAAAKPRKVTNVKVTKITATSAKVTWDKVSKADYYEIKLSGDGDRRRYNELSFKCSYTFDDLNPEKKYTIRVRASRNVKKGEWSNKKVFKTKCALLSSYKLSGTLGTQVTYNLAKAEVRQEDCYSSSLAFLVFFTATNNSGSDAYIWGPDLNGYQNGIKLSSADSGIELNDRNNGLGETIASGYSISGWIGFRLRDEKTPVVLRCTHEDSETGRDIIDFELTVKLV